jgi:hypothetical protein
VHKSRRQGNYHALIPSSDPKKDLEKEELEYEVADAGTGGGRGEADKGGGRVRLKHVEEEAPFLGWLRPAWHDFKVELKFWNSEGAKQRDERYVSRSCCTSHLLRCLNLPLVQSVSPGSSKLALTKQYPQDPRPRRFHDA